jgi:hypothetical protein
MQSVVRSTFLVGALAFATVAGLTACGDKVNVVGNPSDSVVTSVTVTPPQVNMQVGDVVTLAASVTAGPLIKDKTVKWTSSNAAVATVDANGVVTAKGGGTTTIIAASNADPNVKGAAAVTVGAVVQPTVTISTINQTTGAGSVPAVLGNVIGQLDVTLNVDPGTQKLSEVDLVATVAGKDTTVATQTLSSADVVPLAEAASAPITLSFNTAFFNGTTGVTAFKNGQITLKGVAKTTQGTQVASGGAQLTLNNVDALVGTLATGASAQDLVGQTWNGTSLTVTVVPVFYTPNRSAASTTFGLNGNGNGDALSKSTTPSPTSASQTFTDGNGAANGAATDINQVTNDAVVANATVLDNSGINMFNVGAFAPTPSGGATFVNNPIYTPQSVLAAAPKALPAIRLDTRKPLPGTFSVAPNVDQNINPGTGYVGAAFKFTNDSSSGYRGPDQIAGNVTQNLDKANGVLGGVDKVTVVFQFRTGNSGSWTSIANTTSINESVASNTYSLRMITTDALGNADTTNDGTFGVDKTPPTIVVGATPANDTVTNTASGLGSYTYTISDNLSGPAISQLVAVVRNWNGLSSVSSSNEGRINTNIVGPPGFSPVGTSGNSSINPCYVGRFNATQAAAGANALPVFNAAGTALGFCTPVLFSAFASLPTSFAAVSPASAVTDGYWTAEVIALDEAANQLVGFTRTILEDATAPTVTNIDPPPTAVGNGVVAFPATVADNAAASVGDIVGSFFTQTFAAAVLQFPTQAGPGVAFDNVLTNAPTLSPQFTNYIKNLQALGPAATALAPVGGGNNSAVTVTAIGAADLGVGAPSRGTLTYTFQPGAPQLVAGSANTWPCPTATNPSTACTQGTLNFGWSITGNHATLSNCPAAGCTGNAAAVNPLAVALTVTAGGPTQTFPNPLVGGAVTFWYRVTGSGGPWFFAGNGGAGNSRDDLVHRFWDFSFTFDPPVTAPDGTNLTINGTSIDIVAIGVNTAGDGIVNSTPFTVILSNP